MPKLARRIRIIRIERAVLNPVFMSWVPLESVLVTPKVITKASELTIKSVNYPMKLFTYPNLVVAQ